MKRNIYLKDLQHAMDVRGRKGLGGHKLSEIVMTKDGVTPRTQRKSPDPLNPFIAKADEERYFERLNRMDQRTSNILKNYEVKNLKTYAQYERDRTHELNEKFDYDVRENLDKYDRRAMQKKTKLRKDNLHTDQTNFSMRENKVVAQRQSVENAAIEDAVRVEMDKLEALRAQ
mmetsp:Transcript_8825/g.13604  ORF Transcript_8825/g.13604 Transcript_8825/m.13604 type:complete len:173 (+) Transcript_8825:361-879(+)|eukprot:CAMPEP_0170487838 /NCGR_PEP_ID=MMETSP0208-20121228/6562_1 /TAXON_ID=197538 /ORGANISM="Strombidium inclinatum, Strain S3" /LENGTH=172 /DNA_ID=CAMNT_0010762255 /DNA_START=1104 /DNA_END=1622 /DNA_ORIENTATION=+